MCAHRIGRLWKSKTDEADEWVRSGDAAEEEVGARNERPPDSQSPVGQTKEKALSLRNLNVEGHRRAVSGQVPSRVYTNAKDRQYRRDYICDDAVDKIVVRSAAGKRDVEAAAGKYNLSDFSARLGTEQLARLEGWCAARERLAMHYFTCLEGDDLLPPRANPGHGWNLFTVLLPLEGEAITLRQFMDAMQREGIGTGPVLRGDPHLLVLACEGLARGAALRVRAHRP